MTNRKGFGLAQDLIGLAILSIVFLGFTDIYFQTRQARLEKKFEMITNNIIKTVEEGINREGSTYLRYLTYKQNGKYYVVKIGSKNWYVLSNEGLPLRIGELKRVKCADGSYGFELRTKLYGELPDDIDEYKYDSCRYAAPALY